MEKIMILNKKPNNYNMNFNFDINITPDMLNNKLCCTFFPIEEMDNILNDIILKYNILYNKIFILDLQNNSEFVFTYNIDPGNINNLPTNTILVHRKKQTNTLYTINALNELIKSLNGGKLDRKYPINWDDYKNTILLTQGNELKILNTCINRIIEL